MNIPHKCPICEGRGEIKKNLAQVNSVVVSTKPLRFRCHGCGGIGMVWEFVAQPFSPWISPLPPFGTTCGVVDLLPKCDSCQESFLSPPGKDCQNFMGHVQSYNIAYPGGNTCGCPRLGPHTPECMSTWKFPSDLNGQAPS